MYWPKHILIDHNRFIRYEHAGYGGIEDFENAIVELLEEGDHKPTEDRGSENPTDDIFEIHEIQIIPHSDNFIFYTFVFG
jgi:hypothetical protein